MKNLKDNLWSAYDFQGRVEVVYSHNKLYRQFEVLSDVYFEVAGETQASLRELVIS